MAPSINWSSVKSNTLLVAWLIFGTVTVLVPPMQWGIQRTKYYKSYGKYVAYEQKQRQYEEQANQNNNNNNNNNNNGNYYSSLYKNCARWNWSCQSKQEKYAQQYFGENNNNNNGYDENGNPVSDESIPTWFKFLSGSNSDSEAMRRWKEENTGQRQEDDRDREEGRSTGGEIVVAIYMVFATLAVVVYGANRLYQSGGDTVADNVKGPIIALILLANLLILMLLLVSKLVSVEDRMMEDSVYGWYGQVGVLIAYISFWGLLFSVSFLVAFYFILKGGKTKTQHSTEGEFALNGDYVTA